ncbi:uncharacterized protein LOC125372340 [Haliotis rufescens]|uniref:uncharacterized protein LOC125372340 n=1 Tax=Haliotis rufescens TaxID=6454 RepID=UPI00201F585F|nr:uncharacterized protein LOC125372340 [Haliotis rufescens]
MYTEMHKLLRKYLAKFVKIDIIKTHPLTEVPFTEKDNQLPDSIMAVGIRTREFISRLDDLDLVNRFMKNIRLFYQETVVTMLKKFPFGNEVLKHIGWINPDPEKKQAFTSDSVLACASAIAFPLTDELTEEFLEYSLTPPEELPSSTLKPEQYWIKLQKQKTLDGTRRFKYLSALAIKLCLIPNSNADTERLFSMVKKIKTEGRSELDNSTVCALLSCKVNCKDPCYSCTFSKDTLCKAKCATKVYNSQHI